MAVNSGSSNPIGVRTGAVTDPAPAVNTSVKSAIKSAAASEIVAPHRHPSDRADGKKEDAGAQKGVFGYVVRGGWIGTDVLQRGVGLVMRLMRGQSRICGG